MSSGGWYYRIAKKEIHRNGELIETQYGVVEYYPKLNSWTINFQEPLGFKFNNNNNTEQEALDDLIWSIEKMLEAAKKARDGMENVIEISNETTA